MDIVDLASSGSWAICPKSNGNKTSRIATHIVLSTAVASSENDNNRRRAELGLQASQAVSGLGPSGRSNPTSRIALLRGIQAEQLSGHTLKTVCRTPEALRGS